jgi:hypothetical protein
MADVEGLPKGNGPPAGFHVAVIFASTLVFVFGTGLAFSQTEKQIRGYQEMLIWTGDYDGLTDGVRGEGTNQAITRFQTRIEHAQTGQLTAVEVALLQKEGQKKKAAAGFEQVDDNVTGVSVGMPLKLISGPTKKSWGQNWASPDDSINVGTVRYIDVALPDIFNRLMNVKERQVTYFRLKEEEWCVVSGIDRDGAHIYVRMAERKSTGKGVLPEVRGFSLRLVGSARDEWKMLPAAMTSTFGLITVAPKLNVSEPAQDLLKTPPQALKEGGALSTAKGTGVCFNGLGDCPPSGSSCLKGTSECPPLLKGE